MPRFSLKLPFVAIAVVAALAALATSKDREIRARLARLEDSLTKDGASYGFGRRTVIDAELYALRVDGDLSLETVRRLKGSRVFVIWLSGRIAKDAEPQWQERWEKDREERIDGRTYEVWTTLGPSFRSYQGAIP